jgi:hypothetical protein
MTKKSKKTKKHFDKESIAEITLEIFSKEQESLNNLAIANSKSLEAFALIAKDSIKSPIIEALQKVSTYQVQASFLAKAITQSIQPNSTVDQLMRAFDQISAITSKYENSFKIYDSYIKSLQINIGIPRIINDLEINQLNLFKGFVVNSNLDGVMKTYNNFITKTTSFPSVFTLRQAKILLALLLTVSGRKYLLEGGKEKLFKSKQFDFKFCKVAPMYCLPVLSVM